MPALPHVVTFPGKVRVVEPGPKDPQTNRRPLVHQRTIAHPKFLAKETHPRMRGQTVTQMTVPAGFHLDYELRHTKARGLGGRPEKPLALVKVVPDGEAPPVAHAELAHTHEEATSEIRQGTYDEEVTLPDGAKRTVKLPNMVQATTRKVVSVTAKSLEEPDVVGTGSDAASAVADMHAKLAAKRVSKGVASKEVVTREGAPEELPPAPKLGTIDDARG